MGFSPSESPPFHLGPSFVPQVALPTSARLEELTEEELGECERGARLYIERDDFEIEITKVPQITEYFRAFKALMLQREQAHQRETTFLRGQLSALRGQLEAREVPVPRFQRTVVEENTTQSSQAERVVTLDLEDKLAGLINAKKAALLRPPPPHTLI